MYLLWWDKPFDVKEPFILSHRSIHQIAAYVVHDEYPDPDLMPRPTLADDIPRRFARPLEPRCQELSAQARLTFGLPAKELTGQEYPRHYVFRQTNWPRGQSKLFPIGILPPAICSFACACYGGLHLGAWHSFFPTTTEALLWKLSSICIAASCFIFGGCYLMVVITHWIDHGHFGGDCDGPFRRDDHHPHLRIFRKVMAATTFILTMATACAIRCVYVGARCFLVIESFLSLRLLQQAAYDTPDWTQWIPHL